MRSATAQIRNNDCAPRRLCRPRTNAPPAGRQRTPVHMTGVFGLDERLPHANISFVNTALCKDTKLFLDPWLIERGNDPWCIRARQIIASYFDQFFVLYGAHASDARKLALFHHCHEINAPRLGYGNGSNGKAKTPEELLRLFRPVSGLMDSGIALCRPSDLPLFIRGFAEDCLSDMMTNILLEQLMNFTLEQCRKYGTETRPCPPGYFYWSAVAQDWQEYQGQCLLVNEKPVLLVPKAIVRDRFYFTTGQFFSRVILERIQRMETYADVNGKEQRPKKGDLKTRLKGEAPILDCTLRMIMDRPAYLPEYHQQLPGLYREQGMTDEDLDRILYH